MGRVALLTALRAAWCALPSQHDVDQKTLTRSLHGVVESVVNEVGVDVNTASPHLLTHVAGVGAKMAATIVAHRSANGAFACRQVRSRPAPTLARRALPRVRWHKETRLLGSHAM